MQHETDSLTLTNLFVLGKLGLLYKCNKTNSLTLIDLSGFGIHTWASVQVQHKTYPLTLNDQLFSVQE